MSPRPFDDPDPGQLALIDAVWSGRGRDGEWPVFNFVMRTLERRGLDAIEICQALPREAGHAAYTYIWSSTAGTVPQATDRVQLTLVGLEHIPDAAQYVEDYLGTVSAMAERVSAKPINPTEIEEEWIDTADLIRLLDPETTSISYDRLVMLQDLLDHERATWGGRSQGAGMEWSFCLPPDIGKYRGLVDLADYLQRAFGIRSESALAPALLPVEEADADGLSDSDWAFWCDPGLWSQISRLVDIGEWDAVAQKASVYLETELRRLGGLGRDSIGQGLVTAVLHPRGGTHQLSPDPAEAGGWHQLACGFFLTARNNANHGYVTDVDVRYAMGVVGTVSLLLTQMNLAYPGG